MNKYTAHILLFAILIPCFASAKKASGVKAKEELRFVENKGEVIDQYGKSRADIQYKLVATPGLTIFAGPGQLHYQFSKQLPTLKDDKTGRSARIDKIQQSKFEMYRLDVTLEGANPRPNTIAGNLAPYKEKYNDLAQGQNEQTANAYESVTYENIYPGIDWKLYIKNGKLEYDFIVHPGGNVTDIRVKFDGAEGIAKHGSDIAVATPMGKIYETGLTGYERESGLKVACGYEITDNVLRFTAGAHNGTLVLDPTLYWGTYYGGINAQATAMAAGDSGTVYMAGYTTSPANVATTGAHLTTYGGDNDAFLAKFDSTGSIRWATYYGGSSVDQAFGIASDSAGNVYLTGLTSSTTGIATSGSYQNAFAGGIGDAFLAKFNGAGTLLWGTYYGGSGTELGTGACLDHSGHVYMTGYTSSTDSIATAGAFKTGGGGSYVDGFLAKFNASTGAIVWATYYGGSDDDEPVGVACDDSGNVYMAGATSSTDSISTPGAYQLTFQTSEDDDGMLIKFDSSGHPLWGTYYGANGSNELEALICDGAGNIYMTGSTSCTDSIATPGAMQTALAGSANAYLVKFNTAGTIQWGTYYGNTGDGGNALATDGAGNIYVTGATTSTTGMATPGTYQTAYAGGGDAFLADFSTSGSLVWGTYYGGTDYDEGFAATCGPNNTVFVSGITKSATGIATPGAYDTVFSATTFNDDAFLAKFGPGTPAAVQQVVTARISVYPNPATDFVNFEVTGIAPGQQPPILTITDEAGHSMGSHVLNTGSLEVKVSSFSPGIYNYQVSGATGNFGLSGKFVVSHN